MRSMVLRQIAFFPASITGAGAFDTEEQRIVKCKSVVWVRERSERNLYEKQKKESFRDFCAGKCSVTRWDGSREVKNKKLRFVYYV